MRQIVEDIIERNLEAFIEMAKRYFDADKEKAIRAFAFYMGATTQGKITDADIQWAKEKLGIAE